MQSAATGGGTTGLQEARHGGAGGERGSYNAGRKRFGPVLSSFEPPPVCWLTCVSTRTPSGCVLVCLCRLPGRGRSGSACGCVARRRGLTAHADQRGSEQRDRPRQAAHSRLSLHRAGLPRALRPPCGRDRRRRNEVGGDRPGQDVGGRLADGHVQLELGAIVGDDRVEEVVAARPQQPQAVEDFDGEALPCSWPAPGLPETPSRRFAPPARWFRSGRSGRASGRRPSPPPPAPGPALPAGGGCWCARCSAPGGPAPGCRRRGSAPSSRPRRRSRCGRRSCRIATGPARRAAPSAARLLPPPKVPAL